MKTSFTKKLIFARRPLVFCNYKQRLPSYIIQRKDDKNCWEP